MSIEEKSLGNGAVEELYVWFKEQLSKYSLSSSSNFQNTESGEYSKSGIVRKQEEFVKGRVAAVLDALNVDKESTHLVTVRKGFCKLHAYLRPVYAEPKELNRYLSEPDQQFPFKFDFDENRETPFEPASPKIVADDGFFCVYKLDLSFNDSLGAAKTFPERIDGFWAGLRSQTGNDYPHIQDRVEELANSAATEEKSLYCVFAGSFVHDADEGGGTVLRDIFAAYFVEHEGWSPESTAVGKAQNEASALFSGLELIADLDTKLFELQGLKIMADLLPYFVDEERPRSDKISLALERLGDLLKHHLVGRPEWDREGSNGQEAKLFYLATSYEKDGVSWRPRLEMYPRAFREDFRLSSMLISHSDAPSASKFLLKTYLDKHWEKLKSVADGDKLDERFVSMLSKESLDVPPIESWQSRVIVEPVEKCDCLYMVEHDTEIATIARSMEGGAKSAWRALNLPSEGDQSPNRSLLAFVIEGDGASNALNGGSDRLVAFPRAILAFESSAVDAFSDRDIAALRAVVRAFASLIRLITHNNSCLEYRATLSKAFDEDLANQNEDHLPLQRKFVFSVRKIDGSEYHALLDESLPPDKREIVGELLGLIHSDFATLDGFKDHIENVPDEDVETERSANEIVKNRVKWALAENQKNFDGDPQSLTLSEPLVEFLSACTENFQWSAYLSSVAQALGERAERVVPDFQLMAPGYSASRMFMASVQHELRQVVKLSEYSKLKQERRNYKDYVRYRLVNSARMPANGFAFDGRGWTRGQAAANDGTNTGRLDGQERYGALVSDLISAESGEDASLGTRAVPIKTFVTLLLESIIADQPDSDLRMQVLHGISGLFDHGTALWRENPIADDNVLFKRSIAEYIRVANRLPRNAGADLDKISSDGKGKTKRTDDIEMKRLEEFQLVLDHFERVSGHGHDRTRMLDMLSVPSPRFHALRKANIYQISHGDLNSRNLTWSNALTAFLLIDFEHVGFGYLGFDRGRLWLNAICEIYDEAQQRGERQSTIPKVLIAIDELIEQTKVFLDHLADTPRGEADSISKYVSKFFEDDIGRMGQAPKDECGTPDYFVTFFVSLFLNFQVSGNISCLVIYSFLCSSIKEFAYSLRDIDLGKLGILVTKLPPLADVDSQTIHNVLEESTGDFPTKTERRLYFRHLTAARLLTITIAASVAQKEKDED